MYAWQRLSSLWEIYSGNKILVSVSLDHEIAILMNKNTSKLDTTIKAMTNIYLTKYIS